MRVLIACESSGVVRRAFREKGHDAYSCDLLPAEDGSPYHIQGDALEALNLGASLQWDLMIAHPPCTYLCNSGVRWLTGRYNDDNKPWDFLTPQERKEDEEELERTRARWDKMIEAQEFFMSLWYAPIPKIVIENPIPHKYAELPKYDQTIQPYMFGDDASKRTCLWLKGVPQLDIPDSSKWVQPRIVNGKKRWANQAPCGADKRGPSPTRASERSRTYDGIGRAFAESWG